MPMDNRNTEISPWPTHALFSKVFLSKQILILTTWKSNTEKKNQFKIEDKKNRQWFLGTIAILVLSGPGVPLGSQPHYLE